MTDYENIFKSSKLDNAFTIRGNGVVDEAPVWKRTEWRF